MQHSFNHKNRNHGDDSVSKMDYEEFQNNNLEWINNQNEVNQEIEIR